MNDISKVIFSRTKPEKKIEAIENLTLTELLSVTEDIVKRIIRDTGKNMYQSRDKELRLRTEYRTSNSWNSVIESWCIVKGKVCINFYVQYENTDTNTHDTFRNFMRKGNYRGEMTRDDRYANPRTYYFIYNESDKARAIRSLLKNYIVVKYKEKLKLS